ncbi:MAG: histidinol-phosphatase [Clostridia bacterium]|nr:histidinol-phosphatase [Clostridia bacterium]
MHSCLSPCGDELMTPNNIARMSLLKGLDLIALTDHNTAGQVPAIKKVCDEIGLGFIPGVEITTAEEAHMLAYFRTVEDDLRFCEFIYPHIPDIPNRPEFFGEQTFMDEEDEVTGYEKKLLISAVDISIDDLAEKVREMGGLPIPAHINRGSNGVLNALGFLPPFAPFAAVEIARDLPLAPSPGVDKYLALHSSDAHRLEDIFERTEFLPLKDATPEAFFEYILENGKIR